MTRAIAAFGNAGCRYDRVEEVPLNEIERANLHTLRRIERAKRCP